MINVDDVLLISRSRHLRSTAQRRRTCDTHYSAAV